MNLDGKLLDSTMLNGDGSIQAMPRPAPEKIAICMPCRSDISTKTNICLLGLQSHSLISGLSVAYLHQEGSCIAGQRNDLVERALGFGSDWVMWIDSDMTFPRDALLRLLRRGKDIIGATYNKRVPPYETLGAWVPSADGRQPTSGIHECFYLPGGMMLVKASVYKSMPYPWYYETYRAQANSPVDSFLEHLKTTFLLAPPPSVVELLRTNDDIGQWIYDETAAYQDLQGGRKFMSEDYNFCRKARDHGHQIFGDLDLTFQMGHVGDHVILSLPPPAESNPAAESANAA